MGFGLGIENPFFAKVDGRTQSTQMIHGLGLTALSKLSHQSKQHVSLPDGPERLIFPPNSGSKTTGRKHDREDLRGKFKQELAVGRVE